MASRYRPKQRVLMRAVELLRSTEHLNPDRRGEIGKIVERLEEIALVVDERVDLATIGHIPLRR